MTTTWNKIFLLEFQVRLVNGDSEFDGRVEVYHAGEWGTVCDDGWDANDAAVVCESLGYVGRSEAVGSAVYGEGVGNILMDDVNCSGDEKKYSETNEKGKVFHDGLLY